MPQAKQVEELIKKFPNWNELFFLNLKWNADKESQKSYFQTLYNLLALRTNIHNFSLEEANEFLDYLQSTRISDYSFLTNLDNPHKPSLPSDSWFNESEERIKNTMGKNLELKILRGTASAQKSETGSMLVLRPYDFAVFAKEK